MMFGFCRVCSVIFQIVINRCLYLWVKQTTQEHAADIHCLCGQADIRPARMRGISEFAEIDGHIADKGTDLINIREQFIFGTIGNLIKMKGNGIHKGSAAGRKNIPDKIKTLNKRIRVSDSRGGCTTDHDHGRIDGLNGFIRRLKHGKIIVGIRFGGPEQYPVIRFIPYLKMLYTHGSEMADKKLAVTCISDPVCFAYNTASGIRGIDRIVVIQYHIDVNTAGQGFLHIEINLIRYCENTRITFNIHPETFVTNDPDTGLTAQLKLLNNSCGIHICAVKLTEMCLDTVKRFLRGQMANAHKNEQANLLLHT